MQNFGTCPGCNVGSLVPHISPIDILGRGTPCKCDRCGGRFEVLGKTLLDEYLPSARAHLREVKKKAA